MNSNNLVSLNNICLSFISPEQQEQKILEHINLKLKEGEIVALLGKSGSGKSTLLRIITKLVEPTKGSVKYGQHYKNNSVEIGMVFQSFALFPLLTVFDNVALGLQAKGLAKFEIHNKVIEAINLMGLSGFEAAYPRELSGGMKQRVGFARALVTDPDILLMDEPFSALDVLTATTLKNDLIDLWLNKKTSIKAILLVTHSIEEAILLADKALVLSSHPGKIIAEVEMPLHRPRNIQSTECQTLMNQIYNHLSSAEPTNQVKTVKEQRNTYSVPNVSPIKIIETLKFINNKPFNGSISYADLDIKNTNVNSSQVIDIAEALKMLRLAEIKHHNIILSEIGVNLATGNPKLKKALFAKLFLSLPIIQYINNILLNKTNHKASYSSFHHHLEQHLNHLEEVHRILRVIINWARYTELFFYNDDEKIFSLKKITHC